MDAIDLPPDAASDGDGDDDWSEEPLESKPVYLGFVAQEDAREAGDGFASHVGGRPLWFTPSCTGVNLRCTGCEEPMPLLVQVYAPLDWIDAAFHRVLYVFCCPKVGCWKAQPQRCVRVLRWQAHELDAIESPAMVCRVCGKPAMQTCSKCRQGVAYCDKAHQVADWQAGHRQHCKLDAPDTQARLFGPRFLFKHFDMETELEVLDAEQPLPEATASAPELGAPATPTHGAPSAASAPVLALEKAPSLPTLAKEAFGPNVQVDSLLKEAERADPVWSHFEKVTGPYPDQVLRYCFGGDRALWVHSGDQLVGDPPACECCGGRRVLELQLMPQLLYYLDLESAPEETAMDWASVMVYACEKSCPPPEGQAFCTEYAWTQAALAKQ